MTVSVVGIFNGDLEVTVNGVHGTHHGLRVDARGVSDGFRHIEYCLRMLLEDGKIKEGQRLHGVFSDTFPMGGLDPLPGEEVPGVMTITAIADEGPVVVRKETTLWA
jgi:hypothetical protein